MRKIYLLILLFLATVTSVLAKNNMKDTWTITAQSKENYNGITLANGRIGLVTGADLFSIKEIVLNGVFDKEFAGGISRLVAAPNFMNSQLSINGEIINSNNTTDWQQSLNMKEASMTTSVRYGKTQIRYTLRAMRNLPYMALGILEIEAGCDIEFELSNSTVFSTVHNNTVSQFKVMRDLSAQMPVFTSEANSLTGMHKIATCSSFIFDHNNPNNKEIRKVTGDEKSIKYSGNIKKGETYRVAIIGAVCSTRDFNAPKGEAERMVVFALRNNIDYLKERHNRKWEELWESDIIIEGCDEDQRDIRLALYYLYSFQRKGSRMSISPMGLSSSQGYNGHVFWDSEIWMLPPMLIMNQELAKCHIDYRHDRLGKAIQRAEMFGYDGAMFPWESDDSGEESTPTWCLTGTFEHHITADIGIAFWNYYRVTKDKEWLKAEGYPVIKEIADFWTSRVQKNNDGTYSIVNVIGANEYAHNVTDNAFTNGAAKVALEYATLAAVEIGTEPDKRWEEIASGIKFHFMEDGTTKEHSTYNGEMIKQADVNLLAYPLGIIKDLETIEKDLEYYKDKIDKVNGPAMGYAILSIICSRMGDAEEAYKFFKKSYIPNKRPPFGVLSESPSSNNPYFATGAGGLLQTILFGFAGLDITDNGIIELKPALPKAWKSLTITGVGPEKRTIRIQQ